jgi:c(7)-type cytochrome triheme protein
MSSNFRLANHFSLKKPVIVSCVLMLFLALTSTPSRAEYADVVINKYSEAEGMRPVIFPHWFHRMRFRCKVCHNELGFEMRAGSNDMTMGAIIEGEYCGMCHNGEISWSVDNCDLCHSGLPGLKSGIRGNSETAGPGRW